jgi:hypothetical protein
MSSRNKVDVEGETSLTDKLKTTTAKNKKW